MATQDTTAHPAMKRPLVTPDMIIMLAVALVLSTFALVSQAKPAHAAGAHRYAVAEWPNPIAGAMTRFYTIHMSSPSEEHISEELWLVDTAHGCNSNTSSWVEMGEATRVDVAGTWYFWDDCRPGSNEFKHW